jgi:TRAP-type C4-dicarboxylate transport system permease small subunit
MTLLNRVAERIALLAARVKHQCRCLSSVVLLACCLLPGLGVFTLAALVWHHNQAEIIKEN